MSNAITHWTRAAELVKGVEMIGADRELADGPWAAIQVAAAQVHATLALTAATIDAARNPDDKRLKDWAYAIHEHRAAS